MIKIMTAPNCFIDWNHIMFNIIRVGAWLLALRPSCFNIHKLPLTRLQSKIYAFMDNTSIYLTRLLVIIAFTLKNLFHDYFFPAH